MTELAKEFRVSLSLVS
jgi:phosphoribosylformylglycinamidine (FGAM) synthase PurS component